MRPRFSAGYYFEISYAGNCASPLTDSVHAGHNKEFKTERRGPAEQRETREREMSTQGPRPRAQRDCGLSHVTVVPVA